jgi:hypothetical protein
MGDMAHLLMNAFDEIPPSMGLWIFLSVGAVSLFVVFIPLVSWIDSRRKEREAFYKAEMMRRLAESSGEGAKAAMEVLREEERVKLTKTREGMKISGVINIGVGIGLSAMLYSLTGHESGSPYLVGLIPFLIGVGMLIYVYMLAEQPK